MARPLPTFKEHALREDAFVEGHALCPGCMEAVTFHEVGRATDNGKKTVLTLGTFCGEVSTLMYPNLISWGRGPQSPELFGKSLGVMHNVFESSPTIAEAVRDVATVLEGVGAWKAPSPNVVALSGDGGALAIGLRSLLHTIQRRARIAIFVQMNEVFANTGFQFSPTALPFADSSTAPGGLPEDPIDHVGLAIAAGAAFVAQGSPAFAPFFAEVAEEAINTSNGTAVVFVPSPCIAGWKFEEGLTAELGKLASQTGLFPCFRKRAGEPGEVKHVPEKGKRPPVEQYLVKQRRFEHLARLVDGEIRVTPGREGDLAKLQSYADRNVERLKKWAAF